MFISKTLPLASSSFSTITSADIAVSERLMKRFRRIVTTEAKAKEVRKIVDGLIAMAVKEKDNFEEVTVKAKVARKDKDGKRVKEVV